MASKPIRPLKNRKAAINTLNSARTGGAPVRSIAADITSAALPSTNTGMPSGRGRIEADPLYIRNNAWAVATIAGRGETVK